MPDFDPDDYDSPAAYAIATAHAAVADVARPPSLIGLSAARTAKMAAPKRSTRLSRAVVVMPAQVTVS